MVHRLSVSAGPGAPHIYVSEASLGTDRLGGWSLFGSNRRCSTQSVGPVVVPVGIWEPLDCPKIESLNSRNIGIRHYGRS